MLLARRAQDLEELRQAEHEAPFSGDQREVSGELSAVDQHPADFADITYQRELRLTTQQLLQRESAQVEAAMLAREKGTYGICQECGKQIPSERLAARPEATLCVDCQRRQEGVRPADGQILRQAQDERWASVSLRIERGEQAQDERGHSGERSPA